MKRGKETFIEDEIKRLLAREKRKLKEIKREYVKKEKAKIYMRFRNGKPYFYEHTSKGEKGITNNVERIKELIRKEVLAEHINVIEYNCDLIEKMLRKLKKVNITRVERIQRELKEPSTFYTKDQLQWLTADYEKNPYHTENLRYITGNGVKVRSKSERIIGNRLEALGIAYRYEPQMAFSNKTIFPDFVILMPNGQKIIWEHFGLMEDEDYRRNAYGKIDIYRRHGYLQHKNLICTWEDDIQDTQNIDEIITRFTHY